MVYKKAKFETSEKIEEGEGENMKGRVKMK